MHRIRTLFDYNFELDEKLPAIFDEYIVNTSGYYYVQEKLYYKIKYLSEKANNTRTNYIRIGFSFHNSDLDNALRERSSLDNFFDNCIFRECIDLLPEDVQKFRTAIANKQIFQQLFKVDLQIDRFSGQLEDVLVSELGVVCVFKVDHDPTALEHMIRIIFHMPRVWNSPLEVALVDPVRAPRISLSYPEDIMQVDMFSFLSKGEESSLEVAHEQLNGIYDIALSSDWVYPISGMIFTVNRKA